MILRMNKPYYLIDDFKDITMQDIVNVLNSFVDENRKLLFSIFEMNLNCMQVEDINFIKSRAVNIDNRWVLPWQSPFAEAPKNIWVKPNNDEEIAKLIKLSCFDILCIVVDEEYNLDNPYYILLRNHDEYEDYSVERLRIIDKSSGDFNDVVLPKLKEIIKSLEITQDDSLDSNMFM